ncbi:hypothetical protein PNOK_0399300 [Pyrrhoderma noxium]|uniref:Uncharacterized protein n=1 Tax=Pyrrhoderma noxium TaxID=2282107 RepID=A0A286UP41_9AGAM|nr:hypothetical protein PNOK_0399300 [Pyrrhoderma noxium]
MLFAHFSYKQFQPNSLIYYILLSTFSTVTQIITPHLRNQSRSLGLLDRRNTSLGAYAPPPGKQLDAYLVAFGGQQWLINTSIGVRAFFPFRQPSKPSARVKHKQTILKAPTPHLYHRSFNHTTIIYLNSPLFVISNFYLFKYFKHARLS